MKKLFTLILTGIMLFSLPVCADFDAKKAEVIDRVAALCAKYPLYR